MKILVKKTVLYYAKTYQLGSYSLTTWFDEFSKHEFNNFNQLKSVYRNASIIANNRVVFNIKGNDFRLVVSINFLQQACYVIGLVHTGNLIKLMLKLYHLMSIS